MILLCLTTLVLQTCFATAILTIDKMQNSVSFDEEYTIEFDEESKMEKSALFDEECKTEQSLSLDEELKIEKSGSFDEEYTMGKSVSLDEEYKTEKLGSFDGERNRKYCLSSKDSSKHLIDLFVSARQVKRRSSSVLSSSKSSSSSSTENASHSGTVGEYESSVEPYRFKSKNSIKKLKEILPSPMSFMSKLTKHHTDGEFDETEKSVSFDGSCKLKKSVSFDEECNTKYCLASKDSSKHLTDLFPRTRIKRALSISSAKSSSSSSVLTSNTLHSDSTGAYENKAKPYRFKSKNSIKHLKEILPTIKIGKDRPLSAQMIKLKQSKQRIHDVFHPQAKTQNTKTLEIPINKLKDLQRISRNLPKNLKDPMLSCLGELLVITVIAQSLNTIDVNHYVHKVMEAIQFIPTAVHFVQENRIILSRTAVMSLMKLRSSLDTQYVKTHTKIFEQLLNAIGHAYEIIKEFVS